MATLPDAAGLITSTDDPLSLERFEQALASLFRSDGNAAAAIERAIERDPACAAGHCLRAGALVLSGADMPAAALAESIAAVECSSGANERERRHAAAARHWLVGDVARAAGVYGDLLRDYPRDRLALLVAHGLDFRLGRRDMLRDRVAAVLPHWDTRDPEYGYLLGMHAFGLEETGDYDGALAAARRSLELVPDNAAAIHVIAHVLEMRGSPDRGIAWLRGTQPTWSANAGFRVHLAWHLALFQIDADDAANALSTYDDLIAPQLDGGNNGLVDASALLWRLQLRGTQSPRRWREVTGHWMRRRIIGSRAFELVHAVMAFAAAKQHARARQLAKRLQSDTIAPCAQRERGIGAGETPGRGHHVVLPRRLRRRRRVDFGDTRRGRSMRRQRGAVRPDSSDAARGGAAREAGTAGPDAGGRANGAQAREPPQSMAQGTGVDPGNRAAGDVSVARGARCWCPLAQTETIAQQTVSQSTHRRYRAPSR